MDLHYGALIAHHSECSRLVWAERDGTLYSAPPHVFPGRHPIEARVDRRVLWEMTRVHDFSHAV
jgi:hypothetical protein